MKKLTAILLLSFGLVTQCQGAITNLTEDSLGLASGNYGTSLSIGDSLLITALTHIGRSDGPLMGAVYLGNNHHGLGVQYIGRSGEKGITGNGKDYAEQLILDFVRSVPVSTVQLGLFNYSKSDDIVIGLVLDNNQNSSYSKNNPNWDYAVSKASTGRDEINISLLTGDMQTSLKRLTVTAYSGQVYVDSIGSAYNYHAVPEPATIALLGFGFVAIWPLRKK